MIIEFSEEVMALLENAQNDNEVRSILKDNGYEPDKVKEMLSDESLDTVSGGKKRVFSKAPTRCPNCGNENRDELSMQYFASIFSGKYMKFRCKRCMKYFMRNVETNEATIY